MFPPKSKFLVVDDMTMMRKMVTQTLRELGYREFVEAVDGDKGWVAFEEAHTSGAPFDVVICDWNMPKMRGIELLQKLRNAGHGVPFIMLTAEAEVEKVKAALASGVSGYILKPFSAKSIGEKLKIVHEKHEKQPPLQAASGDIIYE